MVLLKRWGRGEVGYSKDGRGVPRAVFSGRAAHQESERGGG